MEFKMQVQKKNKETFPSKVKLKIKKGNKI